MTLLPWKRKKKINIKRKKNEQESVLVKNGNTAYNLQIFDDIKFCAHFLRDNPVNAKPISPGNMLNGHSLYGIENLSKTNLEKKECE